ncbi:putative serine protease HtrA [Posidoniimonas polymericola]|uniref:Putative serine protease HtrA n=1 Tax=Posidoniimonas polymericola TaxID=2528002 RepID=A0A5C5YID4_9BACT|nr:trypsin-like peptidase domain-containing protein [Posidoniimonas polymericola]TWT74619.1 putative serine protease HtrA [Posidoniimonas polymericola]
MHSLRNRTTLTCVLCTLAGAVIGAALMAGRVELPSVETPAYAQTTLSEPHSAYAVNQANARPQQRQPPLALTPEELANIRVYEVAQQAVVNITTSTMQADRFFGVQHAQGSGSGSIIDRQGHILTNNHVIEGAAEIQVTLSNGETYEAQLVGADAEYDMAVLKIDAPADRLVPIEMGTSDDLRVGQKAFAVGNPFGLEGTLTTGIVSSLNRSLPSRVSNRSMTSMIQTDAAMNPGNSGGPLLDSRARMIGMNVAIASKSGQNSGVGFAIPVNRVRRFLPELIEHGKVVRPDHGIIDLMVTNNGLTIARLRPNGPADQAGLRGFRIVRRERRQGAVRYIDTRIDRSYADSIVAIDGAPVQSAEQFLEAIDRFSPGDEVPVTVIREGRRLDVSLRLGAT